MLNVMIADDEAYVIKSLEISIPWDSLGLKVVCRAGHAHGALEQVQKHHIDIVITDIQMPGGGLWLCQKLHEQNPRIQLIIVSGYADFAYAQKAIQYGVVGYCLKPVEVNDITSYLKKAASNCKKARQLLSGNGSILDCLQENDTEGLRRHLAELQLNPGHFWISASIGTENLADHLDHGIALSLGRLKFCYITDEPFSHTLANTLISGKKDTGIGIYPEPSNCLSMEKDIETTIVMAYEFFIKNQPFVCTAYDMPDLETISSVGLRISQKDIVGLGSLIKDLRRSKNISIKAALQICNLICASCFVNSEAIEDTDTYIYDFDQLISEYGCLEGMLDNIMELIIPRDCLPFGPLDSANLNFLNIIKYLNLNYSNDISLKSVADHFHLNPSYVSQLFKKEAGNTYTQYLTQLRIEKAKELLRSGGLTISDVCESTGFHDYFYFIKTFKKITGVSPGKFN